ncbi:MAG TPA: hemerythrin domain-containing protein [Kofleriaceae bacterium]
MPTDFFTLLHRDHTDLQKELTELLDPAVTISQLRSALDGVRLGLVAHAEAEDIVLGRLEEVPSLKLLIGQARAAHLAQEAALTALVSSRPGTRQWRHCACHLRELVEYHAMHEEKHLLPALKQHTEHYASLAGAFATERLRQLAMLQPSAPVYSYAAAY